MSECMHRRARLALIKKRHEERERVKRWRDEIREQNARYVRGDRRGYVREENSL